MATTMTNRNRQTGAGNPHLLQVTGHANGIPFPTSPSVPDRRARLKRLNLQIASREKEDDGGGGGGGSGGDDGVIGERGRTTGARHTNRRISVFVDDNNEDEDDDLEDERVPGGFVRKGSVGRQTLPSVNKRDREEINGELGRHRNIVMSKQNRRHSRDLATNVSPRRKSERRRHISRDEREDEERLRLPSIHVRESEPPASPYQDFFLTSVAGFEELPILRDRKSSISSKSSKEDRTNSGVSSPMSDNGEKNSSDVRPSVAMTENLETLDIKPATAKEDSSLRLDRHSSPVQSTPREPPVTSRIPVPIKSRDTKALQRVYLEGLDYMRGHVSTIEEEIDKINKEFHKVQTESKEDFLYYLKECDERLLQANNQMRKHDIRLKVIDSDTRLVKLLNDLRTLKDSDKNLIEFLTRFWDESKSATEQLQAVLVKFNNTVLQRLSNNYISNNSVDLQVPVCQHYALDIEGFLKDLELQLSNVKIMVSSFGSGIHKDLMEPSEFSDKLMVMCDLKAFPILGFVSAACVKIMKMCQSARQWLSRDEQFMHEINTFIKETRSVARRREQVLQTEKQKQKRYEKNVKIAKSMLHNNMEKLHMIEHDLGSLESKLTDSKETRKMKTGEMQQKETMVDFLKVTVQQTKKNYNLQSKKSRLQRQVNELRDYLKLMESELEVVQDQILAKSHEKILLAEKIQSSEQSYGVLKTDLDKFSDNLERLEADVTGLSGQLLQMEIINTIKTSPEALDNLIDRPSTVKLSQSLKERIKERKKKAAMKSSS